MKDDLETCLKRDLVLKGMLETRVHDLAVIQLERHRTQGVVEEATDELEARAEFFEKEAASLRLQSKVLKYMVNKFY